MLPANASTQHASQKTFAAKMVFVLLWSGGFPIAKLAVGYAPPLTLLALRYGCTVCLLIPLFIITKPALPKDPIAWAHASVVGFLVQVIYFGMSYLAFKAGASAGVVAVIVSLQPVLVAALAPRLVGERVGARVDRCDGSDYCQVELVGEFGVWSFSRDWRIDWDDGRLAL
jgi:drug/metabolite transporter (DMT)-like permease